MSEVKCEYCDKNEERLHKLIDRIDEFLAMKTEEFYESLKQNADGKPDGDAAQIRKEAEQFAKDVLQLH